jgi:hypothetical protein
MSLTVNNEKEAAPVGETYKTKERLALTDPDETGEPQRAVPEGDPDARWFYAIKDAEIPLEDAVKYGLVSAKKPDQKGDKSK